MPDAEHADDLTLHANTPAQVEYLLNDLELAGEGIGPYLYAKQSARVLNKKEPSPH